MSVQVVMKHEGRSGDLNDNVDFLKEIDKLERFSTSKQRLEEYFDLWIIAYKHGDDRYVYFTNETYDDLVDGYIINGSNWEELFEFVAEKRNYLSDLKSELLEECTI